MEKEESDALLLELYAHQSVDDLVYSYKWGDMGQALVAHAATGGYN